MPRDDNGGISLSTFRDLIEYGSSYTPVCEKCYRQLDCDVFDMADRFGLDTSFINRRFPIKCGRCGSRQVGAVISPDTRPAKDWGRRPAKQLKPSRTAIPPHLDLWARR